MTQRISHFKKHSNRSGLTLIEIMIALTMTLIVLGAMMEAFKFANEKITEGRAVMEMASQLRMTEDVLRSDLENCTVAIRPHSDSTPPGCFEYIEGPRRDASGTGLVNFNYFGDADDVLMLTVAADEAPFRGRGPGGVIVESPLALVVWWTSWVDRDGDQEVDFEESVRLYRRVLLIRPDLNLAGVATGVSPADGYQSFYQTTDIAAYVNGAGTLVACSLEDLARRERRPYHEATAPFKLNRFLLADSRQADIASGAVRIPVRTGEDIMLDNIAAFDIRAYALRGNTKIDSGLVLEPGDPGFLPSASTANPTGTFVDLNVLNSAPVAAISAAFDPSNISGPPAMPNGVAAANALRYLYFNDGSRDPNAGTFISPDGVNDVTGFGATNVYDTWSPHYEHGGVAMDGIDNDGVNGVDDPGERIARPPYSAPLRGLKVSIRMVEDNTKQVRQSSVIHSFVPE